MKLWRVFALVLISTLQSTAFSPRQHRNSNYGVKSLVKIQSLQVGNVPSDRTNVQGFIDMMRPQNIPTATSLVLAGAWMQSKSLWSFCNPTVVVAIAITLLVTTGSCMINDCFDIEIDRKNKSNRPLPAGLIRLTDAFAVSGSMLALAAILTIVFLPPGVLQAIACAGIACVTLYTPLFKRIPLMKNVVCALIIAGAVMFGGLACSTDQSITSTTATDIYNTVASQMGNTKSLIGAACNYLFYSTVHREIIMDIDDLDGDTSSGLRTVPVLLGRSNALLVSLASLVIGVLSTARMVWTISNPMFATLILASGGLAASKLASVASSGFSKTALDDAISSAVLPLALALVTLCTAAAVGN